MQINLTEREAAFLAEFARKQCEGAKDNLGTMTPIHVVERIREELHEGGNEEVWVDACADRGFETYESFDDLVAALRAVGEDIPPYDSVKYECINKVWIYSPKDYCEAYGLNVFSGHYSYSHEPVAFFLILDEARRYRNDYQKQNRGDCRIYTYGLGYSNQGDMPVFRELLMKMGRQLVAGEEGEEHHDKADA